MDDDSGDESQIQDSAAEDEQVIPKVITPEYFEELSVKATTIIKNFQADQQFGIADDFQKIFGVCQHLMRSLNEEKIRIAQMNDEVAAAAGKVAAAIKISQTDQETIERLKQEINQAWQHSDAAQNREQAVSEQLHTMREKIDQLQAIVDKSEKKEANEELGSTLAKHKESILRERDRLHAEVEELNRRLQIQRIYTDEMEKKRAESENENKRLQKLLDDTSSEAFKEKRLLDVLKKELNETILEKDGIAEKADFYKNQSDTWHNKNAQQNTQIIGLKTSLERMTTQHATISAKLTKITTEYETLVQIRDRIQIDLNQKNNLLKLKESESNKLYKENGQLVKYREALQKKLVYSESIKSELQQEIFKLRNTIFTFNKERDANKKAFENERKKVETVMRDRDLVRKDLQKANRVIGEQADTILLHEQNLKTLENEIKAHIASAQKQKTLLAQVEKERDRNAEEVQILSDKIEQVQEELNLKMNYINELKENIEELRTKLSHVQQQFELTRTERNAFQRDLQATIEIKNELTEKLAIAMRHIEQYKEDISIKESELIKAGKTIDKLEKDKVTLKLELHNVNVTLQNTRVELKEKKIENERLYKTLSEKEAVIMKYIKLMEAAQNEKDLIGTQLIHRNDEINLIKEKNNIIQLALDRAETQYNKRLDDIKLLKIEIANLRSKRNLLARGLANTADMRQEVIQLNRTLTQERVKSKALEEEMMTPMNIHRWRRLSGKDPERMDLVIKLQTLQKRVLYQTAVATEKDKCLQESQKLYGSLKEFMLKLPNHTITEKLNNTQHSLRRKTKRIKALTAELNVTEIDLQAKDCILENLRKALNEAKQDLIQEKREKQKLKDDLEAAQLFLSQMSPVVTSATHKTVGAGFKIPTIINYDT